MGVILKVTTEAFQEQGAIFMWFIIFAAALAAAFTIERIVFLFFKCGASGNKIYFETLSRIKDGDLDSAIGKLSSNKSPLSRLLRTILEYKNMGADYVRRKVNIVFLGELPKIQKNIGLLNMIANIATLLGLLGTIVGLIIAFDAVANVEVSKRAEALAMGISIAMVTTAFGLIIAIPTLFCHGIIIAQAERIVELMDEKSTKLMNKLF